MSVTTTKLSSKGQIVIPKEIRDELYWEAGTELSLVATGSGVSLKAISAKSGCNLGDLIGMLKHDGAPIAIEVLCKSASAAGLTPPIVVLTQ
jgi:AbrB family looped-hinge helix DNA binding protein